MYLEKLFHNNRLVEPPTNANTGPVYSRKKVKNAPLRLKMEKP